MSIANTLAYFAQLPMTSRQNMSLTTGKNIVQLLGQCLGFSFFSFTGII